jgi:hypothetical protein
MWTEERKRLSLGSVELQAGQVHPITGMPCEVPEPNATISNDIFL